MQRGLVGYRTVQHGLDWLDGGRQAVERGYQRVGQPTLDADLGLVVGIHSEGSWPTGQSGGMPDKSPVPGDALGIAGAVI
jgi:hypothetical protein